MRIKGELDNVSSAMAQLVRKATENLRHAEASAAQAEAMKVGGAYPADFDPDAVKQAKKELEVATALADVVDKACAQCLEAEAKAEAKELKAEAKADAKAEAATHAHAHGHSTHK